MCCQISDAIRMDENNLDALSFRGNVELKADDWLKAKETFKLVQQQTDGKDAYSLLALVTKHQNLKLFGYRLHCYISANLLYREIGITMQLGEVRSGILN